MKSRAVAILGFLTFVTTFFAVACGAGDKMPYDFNDDGIQRDSRGNARPRLGWSAAGNLAFLESNKTVSLQVQFEEPGTYTATFGVKYPTDSAVIDAPITAEATIEWSVAGNSVKRVITVTDGAVVTGVAEAVRIVVKDASIDPLANGGGTEYPCSVQVAKGTRGSFSNPPYLQRLTSDWASTQASGVLPGRTFPVPQDCGVTSFKIMASIAIAGATVITDQSILAIQKDSSGNEVSRCDPRDSEWVPLAPGVKEVELLNGCGLPIFSFIYWGVDG